MLTNSCYFAAYQMASIALLARLDSLTHAVANLFKRFSSIFFTAFFLHTVDFVPQHIIGLALTFTGFPLYALGGFIGSKVKLRKRIRNVITPLFYPLVCFFLFVSGFAPEPQGDEIKTPVRNTRSLLYNPDWVRKPLKLFPNDGVERT